MNRRHSGLLDAKPPLKDLHYWSYCVRRAAGTADYALAGTIVDPVNDRWHVAASHWSRQNNEASPCPDVPLQVRSMCEPASALEDQLDSELTPRQVLWIALLKDYRCAAADS
jgi:hypothetical protein